MLPGVRGGPSREYGRVDALVGSLELIAANPFACVERRFRLKTAPMNGRVVDLGIFITGFGRGKSVVGARPSRISELLCTFQDTKLQDSFVHSAALAQATRHKTAPNANKAATTFQSHLLSRFFDHSSRSNHIPYDRHEAEG